MFVINSTIASLERKLKGRVRPGTYFNYEIKVSCVGFRLYAGKKTAEAFYDKCICVFLVKTLITRWDDR